MKLDTSRISRLLDHLSDDDDEGRNNAMRNKLNEYDDVNVDADVINDVCVFPISGRPDPPDLEVGSAADDNIVIDVEDLLQLALDERKGKQEAKQVRR